MDIMRSKYIRDFLRFISMKDKRRRVDWLKVLASLNREDLNAYYFSLFRKLRRGKSMSSNRAAYYTLKKYYSTTTISDLLRKVGL